MNLLLIDMALVKRFGGVKRMLIWLELNKLWENV